MLYMQTNTIGKNRLVEINDDTSLHTPSQNEKCIERLSIGLTWG